MNTIGETITPQGLAIGMSPASEVVITLPEKKVIRRIVVHSDNLTEFDIHADKGSISTEADWQLIKDVRSVKSNPIQVSVLIPFPTDRIRLRVLGTTDDALQARQFKSRNPGYIRRSNRRALGKIREIELYGYKSTEEMAEEKTTDKREKELDDLLDLE